MWKLPSPLVCFQLLRTSQRHHLDLVVWHCRSSMVTQVYQPDVKGSRDCCLQCYVIWSWVEKKDAHSTFLSDRYVLKWGAVELSTTVAIFRETEEARGGHRTPYDSTIILNRSNSPQEEWLTGNSILRPFQKGNVLVPLSSVQMSECSNHCSPVWFEIGFHISSFTLALTGWGHKT